jgi:hypothetical protein
MSRLALRAARGALRFPAYPAAREWIASTILCSRMCPVLSSSSSVAQSAPGRPGCFGRAGAADHAVLRGLAASLHSQPRERDR